MRRTASFLVACLVAASSSAAEPPLAARAAAGDVAALDAMARAVLAERPENPRTYAVADNPALRRALAAGARSLAAADPDFTKLAAAAPIEAVAPVVLSRGIPSLCGLRVPADLDKRIQVRNARARLVASVHPPPQRAPAQLPAQFDWRSQNAVKEVDDQGQCGSCWAFGTTGTFESAWAIRNKRLKDDSKQFILDAAAAAEGYTCDGGWWAFDLIERPGVPLTSEFPYQGSVGRTPDPSRFTKLFTAANWGYVGDSSGVPPVAQIKAAMLTHGPIAVGVLATNEFMAYSGGVFSERVPADQINHAVGLIGWDDGVGGGVWILRNSWSPQWGENGFMQIAYASSNVGFGAAWVDAVADQPSPQPDPTPDPTPDPQPDPTPDPMPNPQPQPPPPPPLPIPPGGFTIQGTIQVVPTGGAPQPSPSPSPDDSAGPVPPLPLPPVPTDPGRARCLVILYPSDWPEPDADDRAQLAGELDRLDVALIVSPVSATGVAALSPAWSAAVSGAGGLPCMVVTTSRYRDDPATAPVVGSKGFDVSLGPADVVRFVSGLRDRSAATSARKGRRP